MNRLYLAFVTLTCVLVMFFHLRMTGNPMSRAFTVFALVEEGSLKADRWANDTEDKAVIDGHTYSDKAPLSSFVVLPFYAAWRAFEGGPQTQRDRDVTLHLGNLLAGAVPFAAFLAMLLWLLNRQGGPGARHAIALALLLGFGSVLFNYGNAYFGHMLAAACFMGAWAIVMDTKDRLWLAGALGACAVLAEYPTAILVALLALWVVRERGPRAAARFVAGGLPGAVALGIYNALITGNPLKLTYSAVTSQWEPMKTHYGMRLPDPSAAWELMFGQFRGMLFYAPPLLLLLPLWLARSDDRRRRFGVLLFMVYWAMMSAYFKWDGGWCTGPRHMVPAVALALYEGAHLLRTHRRALWPVYLLCALGLIINLAAAATDPITSEGDKTPFFTHYWPRLMRGEMTEHNLAVELGFSNGRYLAGVWLALLVTTVVALGAWAARAKAVRTDSGAEPSPALQR